METTPSWQRGARFIRPSRCAARRVWKPRPSILRRYTRRRGSWCPVCCLSSQEGWTMTRCFLGGAQKTRWSFSNASRLRNMQQRILRGHRLVVCNSLDLESATPSHFMLHIVCCITLFSGRVLLLPSTLLFSVQWTWCVLFNTRLLSKQLNELFVCRCCQPRAACEQSLWEKRECACLFFCLDLPLLSYFVTHACHLAFNAQLCRIMCSISSWSR